MKLLRRAEKLAAAAGAGPADIGLIWSSYDVELEAEPHLKRGEYLAVDVVEERAGADNPHDVTRWRCSERISTDPKDLGTIRDRAGAVVGRVTASTGKLLTVEYARDGKTEVSRIGQGPRTGAKARGNRGDG